MRDRLLSFWSDLVISRPRAALLTVLLVTAVSAAIIPGLRVEAGHSKLENKDNIHQMRFAAFLDEFGSPNQLIAMVEGGNERLRRQVIDRLMKHLPRGAGPLDPHAVCQAEMPPNSPACVRDVMARIDLDKLKSMALLYLPLRRVKALVKVLSSKHFGLHAIMGLRSLQGMVKAFSAELERRAGDPLANKVDQSEARQGVNFVARLFTELATRVRNPRRMAVPLEEALFTRDVEGGIDARGYMSSRDGQIKLAFVRPVNDSDEPHVVSPFVGYVRARADATVARLGKACAAHATACPDGPLKVTLTGLPAIVADETRVVRRDVLVTSLVAIFGILGLLYLGFRSVRLTVLGLLPLMLGMVWTLAFVRLGFSTLNLVTSAFIVTLLGLGIDFAVHFLGRFNEAFQGGQTREEAVRAAVLGAGPGILTGALTTSGAFVALAASRFMAFSQLGIITGVGLLLVLITTFTMLPAMLVVPGLGFLHGEARPPAARRPFFGLSELVVRHYRAFVVVGLVSAGAALVSAQKIPWSYNYMELMPANLDSVEAMDKLSRRTDFSAESAALIANSPEQAREYTRALLKKKTISRVESAMSYMPTNQQAKLKALAPVNALLKNGPRITPLPFNLGAFKEAVQNLQDTLEDTRFEAKRGGAEDQARLLDAPIAAVAGLHAALRSAPKAQAYRVLAEVQRQSIQGIRKGLKILADNVNARPVTITSLLASLPEGLRDRMYHKGRFAIYAFPAKPIWEKAFLKQLVEDLRSVNLEATGFPVTHWEFSTAIELGFRDASIISLIALFILLYADFRSFRYTFLAVAPLVMGISWMWGGISLLGMHYNFVNIIAFPLIIGIGVASGVHILHRYRQEGERDIAPVIQNTGMAVFLSAATTMVGFGSLALARHRGAASLGIVLLMGVGACLVTSITFLPALLKLLKVNKYHRQ